MDEKHEAWKFIKSPFQCDVSNELPEEFLQLKFNSSAEEHFKELDVEIFQVKYLPIYPQLSNQALRILSISNIQLEHK